MQITPKEWISYIFKINGWTTLDIVITIKNINVCNHYWLVFHILVHWCFSGRSKVILLRVHVIFILCMFMPIMQHIKTSKFIFSFYRWSPRNHLHIRNSEQGPRDQRPYVGRTQQRKPLPVNGDPLAPSHPPQIKRTSKALTKYFYLSYRLLRNCT